MKRLLVVLAVLSAIVLLTWAGVRVYLALDMKFNCFNYLKRAADANTVEMAKPQLDKAIEYLEDHNLTTGVVSIIFHNPANDVGYFYQNLKASQTELEQVKSDATQLEKSNVLMKLRETLVDTGESTSVTHPAGISVYPNNVAFFLWFLLSFIATIVFGFWAYIRD